MRLRLLIDRLGRLGARLSVLPLDREMEGPLSVLTDRALEVGRSERVLLGGATPLRREGILGGSSLDLTSVSSSSLSLP